MRALRTYGSVGGAGWVTIGSTRQSFQTERRFLQGKHDPDIHADHLLYRPRVLDTSPALMHPFDQGLTFFRPQRDR